MSNPTLKFLQPLASPEAPPPHHLLLLVHAVYLKHVLCQINANALNLHLGFLLIPDW
jgi:hypothetical protein